MVDVGNLLFFFSALYYQCSVLNAIKDEISHKKDLCVVTYFLLYNSYPQNKNEVHMNPLSISRFTSPQRQRMSPPCVRVGSCLKPLKRTALSAVCNNHKTKDLCVVTFVFIEQFISTVNPHMNPVSISQFTSPRGVNEPTNSHSSHPQPTLTPNSCSRSRMYEMKHIQV